MFRLLLSGFDGFLGYKSGVPQPSLYQLRHPDGSVIHSDPICPIKGEAVNTETHELYEALNIKQLNKDIIMIPYPQGGAHPNHRIIPRKGRQHTWNKTKHGKP